MLLPVSAIGDVVVVAKRRRLGRNLEEPFHLGLRPHEELPLDAFRIRVGRGIEAALGRRHLARGRSRRFRGRRAGSIVSSVICQASV